MKVNPPKYTNKITFLKNTKYYDYNLKSSTFHPYSK